MITLHWPAMRYTLAFGLAWFPFGVAAAQSATTLVGVVADSTGAPILGADVSIAGAGAQVVTDNRGQFRLLYLPAGPVTITVRRLGFAPAVVQIAAPQPGIATSMVRVQLTPVPTVLLPVVIRAKHADYTGRLAGYYERLEHRYGGAYFIPRYQIDHENPQRLSQLLYHVPGITVVRGRGGSTGVRLRGRACWPLIWIDGLPMSSGDVDLDSFSPSSIHGIEIYLGSTTAPVRYSYTGDVSSCGTILLWSRGPDTDPLLSPARPQWNLEQLVASQTVYTANEVDRVAQRAASLPLQVVYPPALFAAGLEGKVLAEFVVDQDGKVLEESVGIISSTHPLFSEAVRQALEQATFTPALRHDVAVRQLVQQPFDFVVVRK